MNNLYNILKSYIFIRKHWSSGSMSEPAVRKRGRRGSPESWSVDAHVGQRVRMRRTLLGMSQEKLGEAIGLTFQQVQKYERGSNRISAGTLYRLSQVLDVPVSFFFDYYDAPQGSATKTARTDIDRIGDSAISRREARMLRLWRAAPDGVGDELLSLLSSLSPHLHDARDEESGEPMGVVGITPNDLLQGKGQGKGQRERGVLTIPTAPTGGLIATGGKASVGKTVVKGASPRIKVEATGGKRRRHGAVWDPADIYRAGKPNAGKPGKAST
ncbi:transcriptional regulator with XRE-family HTH domain [Azospirillum sp. OGB3]|nr:transcriptional regulator with XRE-family HTH domain [Azospirillum sp. OGB3]